MLFVHTLTVLSYVGFWFAVMFTPVISIYWPWWRHDLGWTIAAESWAFAVLLLPTQLHLLGIHLDRNPVMSWLFVAAFALAISVFPWRAIATYVVQRRGAKHERRT